MIGRFPDEPEQSQPTFGHDVQDPEEKKEPAPQREMREAEVKKVRKRVSMKALLPLKKAEVAEREKKPPEASAPSRRPGMGVDD